MASVYTRCINALVTKHQDYDRSAIDNYLLTGSCVLFTNFDTLPEFDLDTGVLSGGVCAIRCLRTSGANPPANKEFMAIVHVVGDETVNVTGTRKIFIEIPENLVNDGTLINNETTGINDQRLGLGIAVIKSELTYPAHTNYIPLREINAGVPTDVRPLLLLKDAIFSALPASKITGGNRKFFATNGSGVLQEIDFGTATQVLTSNGLTSLPSFQSPNVDIAGLDEFDPIEGLDEMVVYRPGEGNIKVSAMRKNIQESYVCGENVIAGRIGRLGEASNNLAGESIDTVGGVSFSTSASMIGYNTTHRKKAQSFTVPTGGLLDNIVVALRKAGSPAGQITCKIYSDTGTTLLETASNTISEASVTTSYANYQFDFSGLTKLTPGVYYVELSTSRADDLSNHVGWGTFSGSSYAGGSAYFINSSDVWSVQASREFDAIITLDPFAEDLTKLYLGNPTSKTLFGIIEQTKSIGEDCTVTLFGICDKVSGLTGGVRYGCGANGALSSSEPYLCKAISATKVFFGQERPTYAMLQTTRAINGASGVVNIPHPLGVKPSYCRVIAKHAVGGTSVSYANAIAESIGFSDFVNNGCSYNGFQGGDGTHRNVLYGNQANRAIYIRNTDSAVSGRHQTQEATITADASNIIVDFNYSSVSSVLSNTISIMIEVYA